MKKHVITALIGISLLLGGGAIGYAVSNAFLDVDGIRANFNTVFEYGKTKSQKVTELESQLNTNTETQEKLMAEIEQIRLDNQKNLDDKQKEIDAKQREVDAKQQEADNLRQQLDSIRTEKEQLEQKVRELKQYTDDKVKELPK